MRIEEVQRWKAADPFIPFVIEMKDGRVFRVPQSEYIWVPVVKGNEWVLVADGAGSADRVYVPWIVSITPVAKARKSPRKKRAG